MFILFYAKDYGSIRKAKKAATDHNAIIFAAGYIKSAIIRREREGCEVMVLIFAKQGNFTLADTLATD